MAKEKGHNGQGDATFPRAKTGMGQTTGKTERSKPATSNGAEPQLHASPKMHSTSMEALA
eukprot:334279-Lingulodinium_polyedra.AAC.1